LPGAAAAVDARTAAGATPLMLAAARGGCARCARLLLAAGADPAAEDGRGWAPLHAAARRGHEGVLRALCSSPGADLDARLPDGSAALLLAAEHGHAGCIEALLEAGAHPLTADEDGWTAGHWGAFNGQEAALEKWVGGLGAGGAAAAAAVAALTADGDSAADLAAQEGHEGAEALLLRAAAAALARLSDRKAEDNWAADDAAPHGDQQEWDMASEADAPKERQRRSFNLTAVAAVGGGGAAASAAPAINVLSDPLMQAAPIVATQGKVEGFP
jgi:ankyrin repeat protein